VPGDVKSKERREGSATTSAGGRTSGREATTCTDSTDETAAEVHLRAMMLPILNGRSPFPPGPIETPPASGVAAWTRRRPGLKCGSCFRRPPGSSAANAGSVA
jgi:hypothetical protein